MGHTRVISSLASIDLALAALLLFYFPDILNGRARVESGKRQSLLELEQHWLESEDNPDALEKILAEDFIHVLPSGFVTKREQLRYMRAHPANRRGTTRHFEDMHVRIFESNGIVNGIVVASEADGKVRKTIFTDVFVYRDKRWQAVNGQESPFTPSAGR